MPGFQGLLIFVMNVVAFGADWGQAFFFNRLTLTVDDDELEADRDAPAHCGADPKPGIIRRRREYSGAFGVAHQTAACGTHIV